MVLMKWRVDYSVNVSEIDAHHQHLFLLINKLNDSMSNGNANQILGETLHELVQYATYHFRAEERLMLEMQYPGLETHIKEHEHMLRRVLKFQEDFSAGKAVMSIGVLRFLCNWLKRHILITDKKYSLFMEERHQHHSL